MATKKTTTSEIKFGADDEPANITFGADDQPAAKGELPEGVKPSTGRKAGRSLDYEPATKVEREDTRNFASKAADVGLSLGGAAIDAVGAIPTAVGGALKSASDLTFGTSREEVEAMAPGAVKSGNAEKVYQDVNRYSPLHVAGRAADLIGRDVKGLADTVRAARSPQAKAVQQNAEMKGDITKPDTWSMGADPSVEGVLHNASDVMGSMAPVVATAIATRGRSAATQVAVGAGVGTASGAGAAIGQVRDTLAKINDDDLIKESPVFRGFIEQGMSRADARARLGESAERHAAAMTAPVSGAGGAATAAILGKMGGHALERIAGTALTRAIVGAGISGLEEGTQEVAEGMATAAGLNSATGMKRDVMEDSFGNFVGGVMGGGVTGGAKGATTPHAPNPSATPNRAAGAGIPAVPAAVPAATPAATAAPATPVPAAVPPAAPETASGKPAGALARAAARVGATPGNPVLLNGDPEKAQEAADKVLELEKQDEDARRMDEAMATDTPLAETPFDRIPDGDLIANEKDKEKWAERQAREPDRSHETTTETTDEAPTTPAPAPAVPVSPVREEASAASSVDEGGPATVAATAGQANAAASSQQKPAQDRNADVGRVDGPPDAQGDAGATAVQPAATPAAAPAAGDGGTSGEQRANLAPVADAQRPAGVPDRPVGASKAGAAGSDAKAGSTRDAGAVRGRASDQPAATYNSIEDATAFIREQRARGTSIAAVPVITADGEITVAVKGTPDYERGVDQRQERNAKKANEQAGILDGDTLHPKTGKPWTTKGSAVRAAKDAPGMEPAEVKGGFVLRKAAPTAIEKEATSDSANDDVRMADPGGARSGSSDDAGSVGNRAGTADAAPARADAEGAAAAGAKSVVRDAGDGANSALTDPATGKAPASWVLRNKTTGEVQMETSDPKKVAALNTAKYEAVPVGQHLQEVNDPTSLAGRVARGEKVSAGTAPEHKPTTGAKTEQFTSPALTTARAQVEAAAAEWDDFSGKNAKHLVGKNKKRKPSDKAPAEVKERFARYEAMRDAASHAYNAALTSAKMGVGKGKPVTVDDASLKDGAAVPMTMDTKNFKVITDEWAALFADPAETTKMADKAKAETLTPAAAKARIADWKAHAKAQGADPKTRSANAEKTIISLFDLTGEWSRPWEEAGYNVLRFDLQSGQDVMDFSVEHFTENYDISDVYAILAATPCTDFASSGAKHFLAKDKQGQTEQSVALVNQTAATIEYLRPPVWALENPVGRIQNLTGLPDPRLSFDPAHFGDPYTKKTMIWGNFNADLPAAPVEATEGSKMHSMFGGKSIETKNARSETPEGFSYAFFMANNYADMPAEQKLASQYPEASGAVQEALKAGVTEARIHELMDDTYGNYEYEDARTVLAEEVAKQAPPPAPPPAPKPKAEKKAKPAAQEATGSLPATDTPAMVTPHATNKTDAAYLANITAVARHYAPGNIVKSYGNGIDRVVSFQPPGSQDRGWSVRVQAVAKDKATGEWVANGPIREHNTTPTKTELSMGLVQKAEQPKVATYAERKVHPETAAALVAWAKEQGFTKVLKPEDMHITTAYSQSPMRALDAGIPMPSVRVAAGKREVKQLGSSIVLTLKSPVLERRWQEYRDAGASWDFPTYQPHISIALADDGAVDLSKIAPYTGPLEFTYERTSEIDEKHLTKTVTVATAEKQAEENRTNPGDIPEENRTIDPKAIAAEQRANAAAARKTTAKKVGWQKAQQREANPFRAFLAERGISVAIANEWLPGAKERQSQGMVPGWGPMFRKNGLDLDMLAEAAVADGFMPEPDVQRLHAMIGQQFSGKRIVPAYGRDAEGYMEASVERQRQFEQEAAEALADVPREAHDAIMEEADSLPFYSTGNETDLAQAMAAMDFTPEEIQDAITEEQGAPAQDGQGRGEAGQDAQGEAREGGQGGDGAASGQGEQSGVRATRRPAARERAGQVTEKIEDFGETLSGARKDLYTEAYKDKFAAGAALETGTNPLSKTWPEPDYDKLLAAGADKMAVAFVHTMRDLIPTKPSVGWKLKGWVQKLELLRDLSAKAMEPGGMARITEELGKASNRTLYDKIAPTADLYERLGHSESLKGVTIEKSLVSMLDGKTFDPPKISWAVNKQRPGSSWGDDLARADTREEAIAAYVALRAKQAAQGEPAAAEKKATKFDIYQDRHTSAYFIGKKIGRDVARMKTGFKTVKEARTWKAENQPALEKLLADYKHIPSERKAENAPRVGQDHRQNGDVTAQQFSDAFGFRGVQFGNYVEGSKRQADLNRAYDSLMDLAAVVGVPPQALSLGGRLGLAFGARGKGGKDAAAAHYEPGEVVINLTKNSGAGSLAHEWWHAMDNYFGKKDGRPNSYPSQDPDGVGPMRPQTRAAFGAIKRAILSTKVAERARELDKRKSEPYWATGLEMSARSFESYIIAKLQDDGFSNDYLANIKPELDWFMGENDTYPYPKVDELPALRPAFDAFFANLETLVTPEGKTELLSIAPGESTAVDTVLASAERATVAERMARFIGQSFSGGNNRFKAVEPGPKADPALAQTLAAVRIAAKRLFGHDVVFVQFDDPSTALFNGAFSKRIGKTIFIRIDATKPHMALLGHELLHSMRSEQPALYAALYKELQSTFVNELAEYGQMLDDRYAEHGQELPQDWHEEAIADLVGDNFMKPEFWAGMAESNRPLARKIADAIVGFLDRVLKHLKGTDPLGSTPFFNDATAARRAVTSAMRQWSNRIKDAPAPMQAPMLPSLSVATPAFDKWFAGSKVVDESGKPLVVYHGTIVRPDSAKVKGMGDIAAFDRMFTTKFRAPSLDTVGSWFSTNPGEGGAGMYSGNYDGSVIYPVYLNIKNPQVTTFQLMQARARKLANGKDDGRAIGAPEVEAYRKWLEATGKDGIKIEASGNEGSTEFDQQTAWIALEPGQIKSATGNRGTYDGNSPDIRLSVAPNNSRMSGLLPS